MDNILKKIADAKAANGKPNRKVLITARLPTSIVEGIIAHMEQEDSESFTEAMTDLLTEGIISSGAK